MRGRKPRPLTLSKADAPPLGLIARDHRLAWSQARHARIVLAGAAGRRTGDIARTPGVRSHHHPARLPALPGRRVEEHPGRRPALGTPPTDSPQRARVVGLARLEPVAKGLHVTHWPSAGLARQAGADEVVEAISPATVRRISQRVDLRPRRARYWRTVRLDERFRGQGWGHYEVVTP